MRKSIPVYRSALGIHAFADTHTSPTRLRLAGLRSMYIARPQISLKKIFYEPSKSKVLFKTKFNDYFRENVKMFDAEDFIADLTYISPQRTFSISDVMNYMLLEPLVFGPRCRGLLHVLLKVGRMSILIMWAPKLKMGKKIVIYHYLKKERLI